MVHDKPLGYDLLIGIGTICKLGGVVIRPVREVQLRRKRKLCAAIMIEGPDFCAVFDLSKRPGLQSESRQETKLSNIRYLIRAELHTKQNWRHGLLMTS